MGKLEGFKGKAKLERVDNKNWKVLEDLILEGRRQNFVVPAGFVTDLASIPKLFKSIFNTYGSYTEAAILHDLLSRLDRAYRKGELLIRDGLLEWEGVKFPESYLIDSSDIDGLFRRTMRLADTNFFARWYMWGAVRIASMVQGRLGSMRLKSWAQLVGLLSPFVGLGYGVSQVF